MKLSRMLALRLLGSALLSVTLVTLALYPIIQIQLEDRINGAQLAAGALLDAEYDALVQEVNESLNQALAIVELPSLQRFLALAGQTRAPFQENLLAQNRVQLEGLFDTLLTHFGRYSRLRLFDHNDQVLLSAGMQPPAVSTAGHVMDGLQQARTLPARGAYISAPYRVSGWSGPEITDTLVDIATPVFGSAGQRLGMLMLTLDWHYVALSLPHTLALDANAGVRVLLVDAGGTSRLPGPGSQFSFGSSLAHHWPDVWDAMRSGAQEAVVIDQRIMVFRNLDLRNHHYRNQARQVVSQAGTQPWYLAITLPRPNLGSLLLGYPVQLVVIVLAYLLALGFAVFWVLTQHRQRLMGERAHKITIKARQYAQDLEDLYEQAPCGYHSLDAEGRVLKINCTELAWLDYGADEVIGKRYYRDFVTPATRDAFDAAFRGVLGEGQEGSAECELLRRDGSILPVAIQATAFSTTGGFQYTRAMVFDLTERKQIENLLVQQSMTDPLTGLGNRRFLETQAEREIARSRRSGLPLSLIAIDLDFFKRVNDTYGHDVGDQVLQAFADTAKNQLRDGDVLCRIGGEEFTVLLPETSAEEAQVIAERLRKTIETTPVDIGSDAIEGWLLSYSASLGVTRVDSDELSLKPAIKRADARLYQAKESGRNRVMGQTPEHDA